MFEKITTYLKETRQELFKVTWPTREELKESTRVVVVGSLILTAFIGIVDQILTVIVQLIFR